MSENCAHRRMVDFHQCSTKKAKELSREGKCQYVSGGVQICTVIVPREDKYCAWHMDLVRRNSLHAKAQAYDRIARFLSSEPASANPDKELELDAVRSLLELNLEN